MEVPINQTIIFKKTNTPINSNAPVEGCDDVICVDWYWQTYVNGVLVYEEFLYQTCECLNSGGGGGGGGGTTSTTPTDLEQCTIALNNIVNATSLSSTLISETLESETTETKTKLYSWDCLKNSYGWKVVSFERGVHKKRGITNAWEWQSLENIGISKEGNTLTFGGTIDATKVWANSTLGKFNATMHLCVNIKATVKKGLAALENNTNYFPSKTFHIISESIPGY